MSAASSFVPPGVYRPTAADRRRGALFLEQARASGKYNMDTQAEDVIAELRAAFPGTWGRPADVRDLYVSWRSGKFKDMFAGNDAEAARQAIGQAAASGPGGSADRAKVVLDAMTRLGYLPPARDRFDVADMLRLGDEDFDAMFAVEEKMSAGAAAAGAAGAAGAASAAGGRGASRGDRNAAFGA